MAYIILMLGEQQSCDFFIDHCAFHTVPIYFGILLLQAWVSHDAYANQTKGKALWKDHIHCVIKSTLPGR